MDGARLEQAPDRAAGPAARAKLEHLTEQDEDGDHRGRFEIDPDLSVVRERCRKCARKQHDDRAVEVGHADADRDEREHI